MPLTFPLWNCASSLWIVEVRLFGQSHINDFDVNKSLKCAMQYFFVPKVHFLYSRDMPWEHIPGSCPLWTEPQIYVVQTWTQPTHSLKQSFSQITADLQTHRLGNKCLVSYWILEWFVMKHYCGNNGWDRCTLVSSEDIYKIQMPGSYSQSLI